MQSMMQNMKQNRIRHTMLIKSNIRINVQHTRKSDHAQAKSEDGKSNLSGDEQGQTEEVI